MKNEGYYLSIEAIASLALLALLLAMPMHQARPGLEDLQIFKQENDLLLLWARQQGLSEGQMKGDFAFAFPGKSGEVCLDGKTVSIGEKGTEGISSETRFFDGKSLMHEIRLTVFKKDNA